MCFKAGNDEMDTVNGLMGMSLAMMVAEVLETDLDELDLQARLVEDLGMTSSKEALIKAGIAEYFDGLELDFSAIRTVQQLMDVAVETALLA